MRSLLRPFPWSATAAVSVFCMMALTACAASDEPESHASPTSLTQLDPEFAQKMTACLVKGGWDVTVGVDNTYRYQLPDESQAASFAAAEQTCADTLGFSKPPVRSPEQARRAYAALVHLRTCLESEGYPTTTPPSEQAFLDGSLFDPYGELTDPSGPQAIDEETFATLLKQCPRP